MKVYFIYIFIIQIKETDAAQKVQKVIKILVLKVSETMSLLDIGIKESDYSVFPLEGDSNRQIFTSKFSFTGATIATDDA